MSMKIYLSVCHTLPINLLVNIYCKHTPDSQRTIIYQNFEGILDTMSSIFKNFLIFKNIFVNQSGKNDFLYREEANKRTAMSATLESPGQAVQKCTLIG